MTNWTRIIQGPGSAETIPIIKKDGMIMVKTIDRTKWLEIELMNLMRRQENNSKISAFNPSTPDQKERYPMIKKRIGLWLNRKKAVIVSLANNIEAKRIITSDIEHYLPYSNVVPGNGTPESIGDRRFWNHLEEYYDKIIAHISDATEIQIFGPEEAKYELQKRLESQGLAGNIVSVEDANQMTDLQIYGKVQKRFPLRSRFDLSGMNPSHLNGREQDNPDDRLDDFEGKEKE